MPRRRFYASPDDITGSTARLSVDETHHLTRVLRLMPGDQAFIFDGCGNEYKGTFSLVADNRAQLEMLEPLSDTVESPLQLTLAQSLVKGEKFDFIVQKATELGVTRIAPLVTRYAEVRLDEQQVARRLQRWQRISLEALKQCGRRKLVEIAAPRTVAELLRAETYSENPQAVLLFSERSGVPIENALAETSMSRSVVALVGPEGGWADDERDLLNENGSRSVTLGRRLLRTETAALVAITLIQHALGDLSRRGSE
ncbi:MAG TPA: 16S rRNA (uracil(1498)-N(3))-methyltransferase [Blastocatellia bacterium]|nr:16S rRNA (uracil(1498)-N(3))-methyltransferase [Blastocatellia bacterium]